MTPQDPIAAEPTLDVSIVLPIHNEVGHIALEIERIRKSMDASDLTYEIVCVDDGSTDGSKERLREIEGIELIDLPTNHGCGFARKTGTRAARGRFVVWVVWCWWWWWWACWLRLGWSSN